ncbi:MAG: hypothetical protein J6S67_07940 [Methanobrevibacter sp.]|nr:hypothetical protein [Methanobrevibacter sp.]
MKDLRDGIKRHTEPEITPGSYWICKSRFCPGLNPTDIFAKVLDCKDGKVHIIRKEQYGFSDLPPKTFRVGEFLDLYLRLED